MAAKYVGIVQTLLSSCKLQGVDAYAYLVDVLQRVSQHPLSRIAELTPRVWKEKFSHKAMKSDIDL